VRGFRFTLKADPYFVVRPCKLTLEAVPETNNPEKECNPKWRKRRESEETRLLCALREYSWEEAGGKKEKSVALQLRAGRATPAPSYTKLANPVI